MEKTTATIVWRAADRCGTNRLVLIEENGDTHEVDHDEPITAASDSAEIAGKFGFVSDAHTEIDHDGDTVMVTHPIPG